MTLVERVARAMCLDLGIPPDNWSEEDGIRTYAWQKEASTAVAAIEAMREPTNEQQIAGSTEVGDCFGWEQKAAAYAWQAMINAALEEWKNDPANPAQARAGDASAEVHG